MYTACDVYSPVFPEETDEGEDDEEEEVEEGYAELVDTSKCIEVHQLLGCYM